MYTVAICFEIAYSIAVLYPYKSNRRDVDHLLFANICLQYRCNLRNLARTRANKRMNKSREFVKA